MPTLKDIAKIAGVHVTTVSKALNNSSDVSLTTREKIFHIARDIGYIPYSRQKGEKNSFVIAAIYPDFPSSYYSRLLVSIENNVARKNGILITACSQFNPEMELFLIKYFSQLKNIDGIILITPHEELDKRLAGVEIHIPIVVLAHHDVIRQWDVISVDDRGGIYDAVDHLVNLGHRHIGYIGETLTYQRLNYFRDAMRRHNLPMDEEFIKVSPLRFEEAGYREMSDLIGRGKLPTAIYAAYDNIAIGVLRAIYEAGLKVPEDISIIGQDDIMVSSYLKDRLTTINCHIDEQGNIAVSILFKKILTPNFTAVQRVMIRTELQVRDSTGAPRTTQEIKKRSACKDEGGT